MCYCVLVYAADNAIVLYFTYMCIYTFLYLMCIYFEVTAVLWELSLNWTIVCFVHTRISYNKHVI